MAGVLVGVAVPRGEAGMATRMAGRARGAIVVGALATFIGAGLVTVMPGGGERGVSAGSEIAGKLNAVASGEAGAMLGASKDCWAARGVAISPTERGAANGPAKAAAGAIAAGVMAGDKAAALVAPKGEISGEGVAASTGADGTAGGGAIGAMIFANAGEILGSAAMLGGVIIAAGSEAARVGAMAGAPRANAPEVGVPGADKMGAIGKPNTAEGEAPRAPMASGLAAKPALGAKGVTGINPAPPGKRTNTGPGREI